MKVNRFNFRFWDESRGEFLEILPEFSSDIGKINCVRPKIFRIGRHADRDGFIINQSTGLIDKDGEEIFEGDIIKLDNTIRFINYNDEKGRLVASYITDINDYCDFDKDWISKYKIIGNIYKNPELLKN